MPLRRTFSCIWSPFARICSFTQSTSSFLVDTVTPPPDTGTPTLTPEPEPAPVPVPGQEQEEREDRRKNKNTAATEAASTSTGTVTTTPFGDAEDDEIAMCVGVPVSLSVLCVLANSEPGIDDRFYSSKRQRFHRLEIDLRSPVLIVVYEYYNFYHMFLINKYFPKVMGVSPYYREK
jgi:hypothetical protein